MFLLGGKIEMKNFLLERLDDVDNKEIEFGGILKENNIDDLEEKINQDSSFKKKIEIFVSDKYLSESLIGKEKTKQLKKIVLSEDFGDDKLAKHKEFIRFINESPVDYIVKAMDSNFLIRKNVKKLLAHPKKSKRFVDENKLISLSSRLANEILFTEDNQEKLNVNLGLSKTDSKPDLASLLKNIPVNKTIELLKENKDFKEKILDFFENNDTSKIIGENKSTLIKAEIGKQIGLKDLWEGDYKRIYENDILLKKYFPEVLKSKIINEFHKGYLEIDKIGLNTVKIKKLKKIINKFPSYSFEKIISVLPSDYQNTKKKREEVFDIIVDEKLKMKKQNKKVNMNFGNNVEKDFENGIEKYKEVEKMLKKERAKKMNESNEIKEIELPEDLLVANYFANTRDLDPLSVFEVKTVKKK